MNIVYLLAPLALLLGCGFAASFAFAAAKGQFDDLETPPHRMILDDEEASTSSGDQRKETPSDGLI